MSPRSWMPWLGLLAGVAALAVLVLAGGSSYVVRAEFADAAGLRPEYTVRLDGAAVGRVASVKVSPHTTAIVTLDLDQSAAPVGRDASVSIQPSNLLGEKFVALNPGNAAHPAPSGALIPLSRTSTPTELDQVISTFDPAARRALAIFLSEQGDALLGRGGDLAGLFARMPHSLQSATTLVAQLSSDNAALGQLVDQSDRILSDVAGQRPALGRLVSSAAGALGTLAGRERALGATIVSAPPALAQLRSTLLALGRAAGPLGQAAIGLRATAPPLTATLRAVPPFTRAALPALRVVGKVSPALDRLGTRATPVITQLQPLGAGLGRFAHSFDPVSGLLNTGIGDLLGLMHGWDRAIQDRDAAGHLFRPYAVTPPGTILQGLLGTYVATGSLTRHRSRRRSAVAAPPSRPSASGAPAGPVPGGTDPAGPDATPPLPPPLSKVISGVTGLADSSPVSKVAGSVSSLLGYLLHR